MKAFLLRLGKLSSSKRFCVQPSTCAVLQKEQLGMFRKSRRRIQMDCPHPLPVPVLSVPPPASPSVHPSGRASLCFPRTSQPVGGPWGVPGEGGLSKALVWISRPPPRGGGAVQGAHLHQRWLHFQLSLTPHVPTLPSTLRPPSPPTQPRSTVSLLGLGLLFPNNVLCRPGITPISFSACQRASSQAPGSQRQERRTLTVTASCLPRTLVWVAGPQASLHVPQELHGATCRLALTLRGGTEAQGGDLLGPLNHAPLLRRLPPATSCPGRAAISSLLGVWRKDTLLAPDLCQRGESWPEFGQAFLSPGRCPSPLLGWKR